MLTFDSIAKITQDIRYKTWAIALEPLDYNRTIFQWVFYENGERQECREWIIDHDMTPSEVVLTALKAAITAEEHETREQFRYKGTKIFGPHVDIDKLAETFKYKENLSLRA